MKWLIGILIATAGIIIPILYDMNVNKPDLVYTISDYIPIESNNENTNNIQQITVKNIGDKPSNDIQVKINGEILESRVVTDSAEDTYEVYPYIFELVYSELPPEGSFQLVIETSINGLNEDVLTIKSEDGLARNGLDEESTSLIGLIVLLFFPIIYFIIMFFSLRDIRIHYLTRKLVFSSLESIEYIHKKKPFYFRENDWIELLKTFISFKIKSDLKRISIEDDFEGLNSYQILKSEKPTVLTDDEWRIIKEDAKRVITIKIEYSFIKCYSVDSILRLSTNIIDSKFNLPEAYMLELKNMISENFIRYKMNHKHFLSIEEINKALTEDLPSFVKQGDKEMYLRFLANIQNIFILDDMMRHFYDPLEVYKQNEQFIVSKNKESLKNTAYDIKFFNTATKLTEDVMIGKKVILEEMPEWMKLYDFNKLNNFLKAIESAKENEANSKQIIEIIYNSIQLKDLPDQKPVFVDSYMWNQLQEFIKLSRDTKELKGSLLEKEEEYKKEKVEFNKLKLKIEKQLTFINDIFNDPTIVDRVESYNQIFAKGNFHNLRELSKYLLELESNKE